MKKRIGIVGGGQLGRMLAQAAHKLGFQVAVLESTPDSPAAQIADMQIIGSYTDKEKILELGKISDFITFEIESANAEALEELIAEGKAVNPTPAILKIIKDKFKQKAFLHERQIPVGDFALIENEEDILRQGEIFGYPFLLKARFDAYDGRGNYLIKNKDDVSTAFSKLGKNNLYAEAFVPFVKEVSVVSARDMAGNTIHYPPVETVHKNNICHIVRSPAHIDEDIVKKIEAVVKKTLEALHGIGVFAIEMFLTKDGKVLINEIAPRVHNSGHHTIEAFTMSQFEAHIRAVTGMTLVDPKPLAKTAVMVNILGERDGKALMDGNDTKTNNSTGSHIHIYGKLETRPERKMGHITVIGDTVEEAEEKALKIRRNIHI